MANALVQTKALYQNNGAGTTDAIVWNSNTTTGNMVLVSIGIVGTTVSSITDSQSNTYTKIDGTGTSRAELWYAYNITGGTTPTVTATCGAIGANVTMIIREYSGLTTTDPLDKHVVGTGASTAASSGATAATAQANELVVGYNNKEIIGDIIEHCRPIIFVTIIYSFNKVSHSVSYDVQKDTLIVDIIKYNGF